MGAIVFGITNLGLGIGLAYKLGYDENLLGAASGLVTFCVLLGLTFGFFTYCRRKNALSEWLTKSTEAEIAIAAEREMQNLKIKEQNARDQEKQAAEAVAKALAEQREKQHDYKVVTL